jgi:cellulose synthase/poly-beta-1,6-N-acetylglucosamine synthase-like glycosyltransferase
MSGEICAFRRSVFSDINFSDWYHKGEGDDFCLTLFIIRKGYRIAYAPDAFVWEPAPDNIKELFQQKVRIISQTIRTMMHNYTMIGAGHGFYSLFILPSRKLLPIFSPFFLITLFFSNLILVYSNWFFSIIFVLQLIFYLLAIAGSVKPVQRNIIPRIANFFILLNFTIIMGWFNYIRGKDFTIWDKIQSSR